MNGPVRAIALLALAAGILAGEWRSARAQSSQDAPAFQAAVERPRALERFQAAFPVLLLLSRAPEASGAGKSATVAAEESFLMQFRLACETRWVREEAPAVSGGALRPGRAPPSRA